MSEWERITAAQIQIGDTIAKTRDEDKVKKVIDVFDHPKSRFITYEYLYNSRLTTSRIRPRHETKFWRFVQSDA